MRTDLYRFVEGSLITTFTSGNREVVFNNETYTPVAMGRSDIISVSELSKANLDVTVTLNNAVAFRWLNTVIDSNITLVLFKQVDGVTTVDWQGRLSAVKAKKAEVILSFESILTAMRRTGLRKRYQRTCPYALYGRGCLISKEAFAIAGTVTAVNGLTLTVAEAALQTDGFYQGGIIENPNGDLRFITQHIGDQLTLSRALIGIEPSASVRIFPGCDRTRSVCDARFDNIVNFGGFPFIPPKNPFGGISIV